MENDKPGADILSDEFAELLKNSDKLMRLEDWSISRKDGGNGESIPMMDAATQWEFTPMVDVGALALDGCEDTLPGLILTERSGRQVACTFSAKSAIQIARFLVEYTGLILKDADENEIRELDNMFTDIVWDNAYDRMKAIVERDMSITAGLLEAGATQVGLNSGIKEARSLITDLVKALDMPDGDDRNDLLDTIAPKLAHALKAE